MAMTVAVQDTCALEALVNRALEGDSRAMDGLARAIRPPVFGLAMRALAEPSAAEDATQEILIKVLTRLRSYRGESRFLTWVHAVALNHLRSLLVSRGRRQWTSFEALPELPAAPTSERAVLLREAQGRCLRGMQACLDLDQRRAFVLGELLELTCVEAAGLLGVTPAAYRKRLSRARRRMNDYMTRSTREVAPAPALAAAA